MESTASTRPLRIAQVAPLWASVPPKSYGGIELVVHLLVEALVAQGHEVTLFASGDSVTRARLIPACEENLLAMMAGGRADSHEVFANAAVAEAMRRADEFDVVHFHIGTQWMPFARTLRTPAVFTMHTLLSQDDAWAVRNFPEAHPVGITRQQLDLAGIADGCVVHHGCDFGAVEPRYAHGKYMAFLGRMSPNKNPLGAIRIARDAGLPIVLAGEAITLDEQAYFERDVRPLIDGSRVRFVGPVAPAGKNDLLRNAAALLFPIQWPEPFGMVMIEAMASGTPVIARSLGSVPELIDRGITGFAAESMDGMAALVPQTLALERRRVRAHAQERFSHERMVQDYLTVYRRILQGRR